MNSSIAFGLLLVTAVNSLWSNEDDEMGNGCCVIHCGPCSALKWFQVNEPEFVNDLLTSLDTYGGYDWQNKDDTMNWSLLQERWDSWPGCTRSNGIYYPCKEEISQP